MIEFERGLTQISMGLPPSTPRVFAGSESPSYDRRAYPRLLVKQYAYGMTRLTSGVLCQHFFCGLLLAGSIVKAILQFEHQRVFRSERAVTVLF